MADSYKKFNEREWRKTAFRELKKGDYWLTPQDNLICGPSRNNYGEHRSLAMVRQIVEPIPPNPLSQPPAPEGFEFTGEYRRAQGGEWYLIDPVKYPFAADLVKALLWDSAYETACDVWILRPLKTEASLPITFPINPLFASRVAKGERFERVGEKRAPREGEWFLSSSGDAHCASFDFTDEHEILRPLLSPPPPKVDWKCILFNLGGVNGQNYVLKEEAERKIAALEENARNWGVVELAARNPNVASYCKEWEERALRAEQKLRKVAEVLGYGDNGI